MFIYKSSCLSEMDKSKQISHSLGATFSGVPFWMGIMFLLVGVYIFFQPVGLVLHYSLTATSAGFGIILILSIHVMVINGATKTAIRYFKFGPLRFELEQTNLQHYDKLTLVLFKENQTMNMRSISTTVRTRSYDIYIGSEETGVVLGEFTDYNKALKFVTQVSSLLGLPYLDKYDAQLQYAKKRSKFRKVKR